MSHPDGEGWNRHVEAHVDYLKGLIEQGKLRASGRAMGLPLRSGILIFKVPSRAELDRLIDEDPFSKHALISELTVVEWDPPFGTFSSESSGNTTP